MTAVDRFISIATHPIPLRTVLFRRLLRRWPIGSYRARLYGGAVDRPGYGWCVYHAAVEARALGHRAMTVVELGVAGGNGLVCLLEQQKEIQRDLGIEILVAGFDAGTGLPATGDPRDLLYCWPTGSFEMDQTALERRIGGQAELVIGDVRSTIAAWMPRADAPLGAIFFDLDLYSSTASAFALLEKVNVLPRIWCAFDDICGFPEDATADRIGEREAIREFNRSPRRDVQKDHLSQAYTFRGLVPEEWHQHIYIYHRMNHPDYNRCLSVSEKQQLPLFPG
jgi:hypothetical protein